jgi:type II secretory pathway pseudopilin PulG
MQKKTPFTIIEVICAIVIFAFAVSTLLISLNNAMFKVYLSNGAIKSVLASEQKLMEYRLKNWSEIPPSESGFLFPDETEAYSYEMNSQIIQNEFGGFLHIHFKAIFPNIYAEKERGFILETDVPIPASEAAKIEEAKSARESNL